METWKSPRKLIEEERERQFALFDELAALVDSGVITMEELKSAMGTPEGDIWVPGGENES